MATPRPRGIRGLAASKVRMEETKDQWVEGLFMVLAHTLDGVDREEDVLRKVKVAAAAADVMLAEIEERWKGV